ncbi:MAG: Fic family protein [Verrucomicrobia bacterium]|nr:Fic family protein [Verrucomicrobiota bacterium]
MNQNLEGIDSMKAELDRRRPLPPALVQALAKIFAAEEVEYIYESNAIEGNTLTLAETELVLNRGLAVGGKPLKDHLEATNHRAAFQRLKELAAVGAAFSESVLLELHGLILHGIDDANAGRYRTLPVRIVGARHIPPNAARVPELMSNLCAWLGGEGMRLHAVHGAADLHWQMAHIHPFTDGNGRTARLAMNLHLLRLGYPVTIIRAERDQRRDYYHALAEADASDKPEPFRAFIESRVVESLDRFLGVLRE